MPSPQSRPTPAIPAADRPTPAIPLQARPTPVIPVQPPPAPPAARPTPPAAPRPTPAGASGRAPINPFLANDPNAKARRLARALISDLITYFPAKRDEGLREGTLKELFREEIKKSFQEYTDQVGKEFAESTDHFRDALNEILAAGNQIF